MSAPAPSPCIPLKMISSVMFPASPHKAEPVRNKRVRFVRDGWGSRKFPRTQIIRMMHAGIECLTCFPVRFPWILSNWYYRDHCKIVVIDGKEAFTGGINIGYEYTGLKPNVGFWRDTHVRIKGEAAADLQTIFDEHWNIASPERMNKRTFGIPKMTTRENRLRIPVKCRTSLYPGPLCPACRRNGALH
jgi:cardiolipin synthase